MSVAERFKSATIADLPIQPSAAYLLAAPAVPDEARQVAIEKAEAGEEITFTTAKEIVAEAKKKARPRRPKKLSTEKLSLRLGSVLERYKERWDSKELAALARQLREFARRWRPCWPRKGFPAWTCSSATATTSSRRSPRSNVMGWRIGTSSPTTSASAP
jgi:hypothetical protein